MKYLLALAVALSATIVWQTSALSGSGNDKPPVEQVQDENAEAGRVPFDGDDCE